jgi:hypothetical protein
MVPINQVTVTTALGAVAALGTAAFGLVDATKAFAGGVSRCGFGKIKAVIRPFFGNHANPHALAASPLDFGPMLNTLRANWLNGSDLDSQKAIAKSLLKLRLNAANSADYAAATGMDAGILATIAGKIATATPLSDTELDAFGRFDLTLTTLVDQAYQRAEQIYRNDAKLLAAIFAVGIAVFGGLIIHNQSVQAGQAVPRYWLSPNMWQAFVIGLLATPLAPIAKDLSTAIVAGVQAVQSVVK